MAENIGNRTGQQVGNYQLVKLLGKGGFADVYLGQHVFLTTPAAIKVLRTTLTDKERESFLNEARTIAQLFHPNIVRVLDFGMQGDIPFLVMDYAPNGSLRDHYPPGQLVPLPTIVTYVKQVAAALQYAHQHRLIHRDVKPENMLVGRYNEVLLTDFGISTIAQTSQVQRTQEVIGSAPYMAPEQLEGKPRPASDQYALGIVVYEWLCGERPFHGSYTEVFSQHLFSPPPPLLQKNPTLPPAIEEVVHRALAKDPHARFASVQDFADALEQVASGTLAARQREASGATTLFATDPHTAITAAATPPGPRAALRQSFAGPATGGKLTAPEKPGASRRISRRGLLIGGAGVALGALVIGGGAVALLHKSYPPQGTLIYTYRGHGAEVLTLRWHNERIASGGADKTVQVWDAATGANVVPYRGHSGSVYALCWSPDGNSIASAGADNIVQVWSATSGQTQLTYKGHHESDFNNAGVYAVAWSPDGKYIASGGVDGTVQVWDAQSGQAKYIYRGHISSFGAHSVYAVAWSPDGKRIASAGGDEKVQVWDSLTGQNAFTYAGHSGDVLSVAWSPDGQFIASAGKDDTVQVWGAIAGGNPLTYKGHSDNVTSVAWSPDGKYIASASEDNTAQVWDPTNGHLLYRFTRHSSQVNAIDWSADSHRLASGSGSSDNDNPGDDIVMVWEGI